MSKRHHDWDAIRSEYVTTDMSTKDISEKYGIRYATVRKKCADGGWVEARKEHRRDLSQQTVQLVSQKTAEAHSEVLVKAREGARVAADRIVSMMYQKDYKPTDWEHLMNALEAVERLERSTGGLLTALQERKLKLEEERLELEKRKVEQHDVDKDITIRIEGYQGEWSE